MFRRYPWNIFETGILGMFLEYFGNITSWLLGFTKRSTFLIIKSYTFNRKTTFPSINFWKIFSFKIFPKSSLDVLNITTLREHSANIPGILRAGWQVSAKQNPEAEMLIFENYSHSLFMLSFKNQSAFMRLYD